MGRTGGYQIVCGGSGPLQVVLPAPTGTPPCKTKEKEGSARTWPLAAPMPKSDYFSREKREMQNEGSWHSVFCLPSTMGMVLFYNASCS